MTFLRTRWGVSMVLECLVGLGIFLVAFLMTLSLLPMADKSLGQARDLSEASQLAHEVMERSLAQPYSALVSIPLDATTHVQVPGLHNGTPAPVDLDYQVNVKQVDDAYQMKDVVVKVSWTHGPHNRTITLECFKGPF